MEHNYLFHVLSITKHADLHLGARDVGQLHRTTETLVLLGIIVFQPDLEFNGLSKITLFLLGFINNVCDGFSKSITLELTVDERKIMSQGIEKKFNFKAT